MTTTTQADLRQEASAIAARRSDAITLPSLEERAITLRYMAEQVIAEQQHPNAVDIGACLELIVRSLASFADTATVMTRFEALVDAVREQQRFNADPRGYAADHDLPMGDRSVDAIDDDLTGSVERAIWDLLSVTPPCRTCVRIGPRLSWRPAQWPESSYCAEHRTQVHA